MKCVLWLCCPDCLDEEIDRDVLGGGEEEERLVVRYVISSLLQSAH